MRIGLSMKKLEDSIPLDIKAVSLFYPVFNYKKEYGEDCDTENIAKGEIEKFNFVKGMKYDAPIIIPPIHWYDEKTGKSHNLKGGELPIRKVGDTVNKITHDENGDEYSTIWVHLGRDYFKQISKVKDTRFC